MTLPIHVKNAFPSLRVTDDIAAVSLSDLRKWLPSLALSGKSGAFDGEGELTLSLPDFRKVLRFLLASVTVDEKWYLAQVPELKEDLRKGLFQSVADHYYIHGYLEGRLPFRPAVDEKFYLEKYPDVARSLKSGRVKSGLEHFVASGYAEGREPAPHD